MEISMMSHLQQYPFNFLLGTLQAFERLLIYMNSRLLIRYLNRDNRRLSPPYEEHQPRFLQTFKHGWIRKGGKLYEDKPVPTEI
jgi:hypothetical protein